VFVVAAVAHVQVAVGPVGIFFHVQGRVPSRADHQ
jgi:hypothetical protein